MKTVTILSAFILLSCADASKKNELSCSAPELEERSDKVSRGLEIFELFKYFSDIDRCKMMDGSIKTGFEDASTLLLSKRFESIKDSKFLRHEDFFRALINSVNDGTPISRFEEICSNLKRCDVKLRLCRELISQCK